MSFQKHISDGVETASRVGRGVPAEPFIQAAHPEGSPDLNAQLTNSTAWLAGWLQMNDTFYPTGSYAHSYGLEALIDEGVVRDRETLRLYLERSVLKTLAHVELPLVNHAWQALAQPDWAKIGELCELSSALKSASEARFASDRIGRQRAELLVRLHAHPLATEYLRHAEEGTWPFSTAVSAALEIRVLGGPLEAAMSSVYYSTLSSLLAAAMKLLRLGQNGSQSLLTEMMNQSPRILAAAREVPVAEIGWFNLWLDIAAARHEHAAARMFIS